MDLPLPNIFGSISKHENFLIDICGTPSANVQQLLLTAYAPKISVTSSTLADSIATTFGKVENVHHLFTYFENVFSFGPGYNSKIPSVSSSGITSTLSGSGSVRFVDDVFENFKKKGSNSDELFNLELFSQNLKGYVRNIDENISGSDNKLDNQIYNRDYERISLLQNSIYLKLISLLYASDKLSCFECFNHPVLQLVVISGNDTAETIEELVSKLDKMKLPNWYDKLSTLEHIIILVDQVDSNMLQNALKIQEDMKIRLGKRSTIVPIDLTTNELDETDTTNVKLLPSLFCTVQRNSENTDLDSLVLNRKAFNLWRRPLQDIISKDMFVFMNSKIRQWNDEVVAPRTSLTGRIFGGRKWGNGGKSNFFSFGSNQSTNNSSNENNNQRATYNSEGGYYFADSSEMILRKLADWYFMLGDYKNAYTIYGLIKKNMINDKAYAHLSSLQECTVFSLLLGANDKSGTSAQPITSKMIMTVINPMIDSSFYSYLSRCNLVSYTLRLTIVTAELFLLLGQTTASNTIKGIVSSNQPEAETYYNESISLFKKVIDSKLLDRLSNGYLMQRVSYIYLSYDWFYANHRKRLYPEESSYYESENPSKALINSPDLNSFGLLRNRKFVLWLLLSIKEMNPKEQPIQSRLIVWRIDKQLNFNKNGNEKNLWLQRSDGLLYKIKTTLEM